MDYPYHSTFLNKASLIEKYENYGGKLIHEDYELSNVSRSLKRFPSHTGRQCYVGAHYDEEIDHLTDMYSEDLRLEGKCKGLDASASPMEHWKGYEDGGEADPKTKRELLYTEIAETKNFRLTWLKPLVYALCDLLKVHPRELKVLDPCMGWGDRLLLACLESFRCYLGFDPHRKLPSAYDSIIEDFGMQKKMTYYSCPFEDGLSLIGDYFDVVLTSPPFFDYERYEDNPSQSDQRYRTLDEWMKGFMFKMMDISVSRLKTGGLLCLYFCDFKVGGRYVDACSKVLTHARNMGNLTCLGVIGLEGSRKIRPVWIWKKKY